MLSKWVCGNSLFQSWNNQVNCEDSAFIICGSVESGERAPFFAPYLTARLTVRVNSPPPHYGQVNVNIFKGYIWPHIWCETNFWPKIDFFKISLNNKWVIDRPSEKEKLQIESKYSERQNDKTWKMHFSAASQLSKSRFEHQRIISQGKSGSTNSQMLTSAPPLKILRSAWPLNRRFNF